MAVFIAVAVILVLMIGFLFVALRGITRRLGKEAQSNAIRQVDLFDDLIAKKEAELQSVNIQLATHRKSTHPHERVVREPQKRPQESIYFQVLQSDFIDRDLFDYYREIKKAFDVNKESYLRSVLDGHKDFAKRADPEYARILDMFPFEVRYGFLTLEDDDQKKLLLQVLSAPQQKLLNRFIAEAGGYNGLAFFDWLEAKAAVNRTDIVVRTGCCGEDYSCVDSRIQTVIDPGICEGVQVALGNTLYDYSIQDMEIYK